MSIGFSIFLIAVGAILHYAVTATISGVEFQTVGLILMIVGIFGLVISLPFVFCAISTQAARRTTTRRVASDYRSRQVPSPRTRELG